MRGKVAIGLACVCAVLFVRNLHTIFLKLPDEVAQGHIYRLLYFHVPSWWTAFVGASASGVASVLYLVRRDMRYDAVAVATAEVSLMYLICGIVLGSIWGRVIWGIWWTWDPRLTSALVCVLLYSGYLALRNAIDEAQARARYAAVFSLFALSDVPIVWFSIRWWRTQHPQPMQLEPQMWVTLLWCWLGMTLLGIALVLVRMDQEYSQRRIDAMRREVMFLDERTPAIRRAGP